LPFFSSLRWRMTAWYGGLLALFVLAFSGAVYLEASRVVWNTAADRVDGVAQEIESFVRAEANDPFGPVSAVTALADQSTLDSFVGPGLYVEVYNPAGYRIAKTTDLGDADLPSSGYQPWRSSYGAPGEWGIASIASGPVLTHITTMRASTGGDATGTPVATVYVAESLKGVYDEERGFAIFLLISVGLALAAVAAGSAWLARATVSPINAIAQAAGEIGGDDLAKRLNWQGRTDELGMLAATFDDMLSRLEAAFARERRLIADASHELKTPLTVINSNAQMLERWADSDEAIRREAIATIRSESASMARVLNAMLTLAKTDDPRALSMEPTELSALIKDAASALRTSATQKGITLEVEADPPAWVLGEPGLLRQLVTNLMENAIKFTAAGGVRVRLRTFGGRARIEVIDTGRGIAADALPHVFERFYRADPARSRAVEGTGLGLAVVRNIVRVHNGSVSVSSQENKGTTFTVDVPLLDTAREGAAS
jgi:two-component system OmpR family sensor kinase